MTEAEKLEYAKGRHALAVSMRDWPEVRKWQEHIIELQGTPEIGCINNTMPRLIERLKTILKEARHD